MMQESSPSFSRRGILKCAGLSAAAGLVRAARAAEPKAEMPPRWSQEKAWQWYRKQGWIVGLNFTPSTACNTTEMWQKETFDPKTIDRELGWAEDIGYNSIRVFIQYIVWKHDPAGFKKRFEQFLTIAARHKISVMPVFFDDCAFGKPPQMDPCLGKQRDLIPGMIAPSWTPSPGRKIALDAKQWPMLKKHVQDLISTWRDDKRIIMWDLYNEPMNVVKAAMTKTTVNALTLLESTFLWARDAKPTQPITAAVWTGRSPPGHKISLEQSDIITFHKYADNKGLKREIESQKKRGRPVVCSEWMVRALGSSFEKDLPLFKREKVGCYQWGLVNGRTQCQFPWWNKPGGKVDPKTGWFTDILHKDGKPYRKEEVAAIKRIIKGK